MSFTSILMVAIFGGVIAQAPKRTVSRAVPVLQTFWPTGCVSETERLLFTARPEMLFVILPHAKIAER